jgi:hypothetical protein
MAPASLCRSDGGPHGHVEVSAAICVLAIFACLRYAARDRQELALHGPWSRSNLLPACCWTPSWYVLTGRGDVNNRLALRCGSLTNACQRGAAVERAKQAPMSAAGTKRQFAAPHWLSARQRIVLQNSLQATGSPPMIAGIVSYQVK